MSFFTVEVAIRNAAANGVDPSKRFINAICLVLQKLESMFDKHFALRRIHELD